MATKKQSKDMREAQAVTLEAREKASARVLKLASLWAREAAERPVLSSRSYHLLRAVLKYEKCP